MIAQRFGTVFTHATNHNRMVGQLATALIGGLECYVFRILEGNCPSELTLSLLSPRAECDASDGCGDREARLTHCGGSARRPPKHSPFLPSQLFTIKSVLQCGCDSFLHPIIIITFEFLRKSVLRTLARLLSLLLLSERVASADCPRKQYTPSPALPPLHE